MPNNNESTRGIDDSAMSTTSYQRITSTQDEHERLEVEAVHDDEVILGERESLSTCKRPLQNFLAMSLLFSANHGCVVSCLALASSRLGTVGAWQSGILMFSYAASALLGATYAVKTLGARDAMTVGMFCYCAYVACFYVATKVNDPAAVAYLGALVGGIGAGFLWTAQGTYFGLASQDFAAQSGIPVEDSTSKLAGYFAFLYLFEEVILRLLSSTLLGFEISSWGTIFGIYTIITVASTVFMPCWVHNYPATTTTTTTTTTTETQSASTITHAMDKESVFYKVTVAFQLLKDDPKMKYMVGLNATFGFVAAFLNSYVNAQVVPVALDDPDSKYIGILTAMISIVAAVMSLAFGKLATVWGKGTILIIGALCFGGVVLPFCFQPDATAYGWPTLLLIYGLHGTGRATFEGTLRSTFADYFPLEKEGAFANIILQNGIASGVGYILTFALICETPSRYCIEYLDGSLHDVLTFELIALVSVAVAIAGYLRASQIRKHELGVSLQIQQERASEDLGDAAMLLQRNNEGVST